MIKKRKLAENEQKVAIITGSSSGFGLLTTLELAKRLFSYRYNEKP